MVTMSKENFGAFIDAVYAIAVTILALEVPAEFGGDFSASHFGVLLVEYSIAFVLLFAFWLQHRRINEHIEKYTRTAIWLTGGILLLVCLLPRATTFVFEYGDDVTFHRIIESFTTSGTLDAAEFVDLFYVGLVLTADALLLVLAFITTHGRESVSAQYVRRSKLTTTLIISTMLLGSMLIDAQNRYFLLILPFALIFERELLRLVFRARAES
jgi:uncharacterized membrane protein